MKRQLCASLIALTIAMPAFAQSPATPAPDSASAQPDAIGDIIVTANRRDQSVQKSSLAIAVLGGEALQQKGVTQAAELASVVPGLTISQGGAVTQTYLRGVGNFATDANAESSIAYNINGVYIARPSGLGPIFFDLERVEVLKGPQGTLYGRNATGGAINLITRRPTQTLSAEGSVDLGNYGLMRMTGALGGGLTETLAVRAAAQWTSREGYLTDGGNDQDSFAGRLTALWKPVSAVSLLVTGEYTQIKGIGEGTVKRSTLTPVPDDPWQGPSVGDISQPPTASIAMGPGVFGTRIRDDSNLDGRVWAVSATLDIDLGPATLTFIPAYRDLRNDYLTYAPGFRYQIGEASQQQSYELRLANDGTLLKWVMGGYYFKEEQSQSLGLQAIPIQQNSSQTALTTESYAAFGEVTASLSDSFRLIGGLRYSHDRKTQDGTSVSVLPAPGTSDLHGQASYENVSFRAGLEYDLAAENMFFATLATGFKAGGFFSAPGPDNSYKPEKLTAFTMGLRNRFLDRTLQVNLEGFYWKYDDKQERYLGANVGTGAVSLLTTNAGKATLYGGNLDIVYKPSRADRISIAVEYLHTKYDSFAYTVYAPPPFGAAYGYGAQSTSCALGPIVPFTATPAPTDATQTIDCSGKPLIRAPKWTGTVAYQHDFDLANGGRLVPAIESQFASSQYLYPDFVSSGRDDGFVTINADLTYHAPDGRFSASLWGKNLTNQAIYTGGIRYSFSAPVAPQGDPSLFYANIRPPRTYGITLRMKL